MGFWILAFSYWIHLLATVMWLGGLALMGVVAVPALLRGNLTRNQWLELQIRFIPWANASLVLLLVTGFVQMTNDDSYHGFLTIDSLWAGAMLAKHIAYAGMVAITAYLQLRLYPAIQRTTLLAERKPQLALSEQTKLTQQEFLLLRLNLICAVAILFCTAIATAI